MNVSFVATSLHFTGQWINNQRIERSLIREAERLQEKQQKLEWADESEELFPLQMIPVTAFLHCLEAICCLLHSEPKKNLFIFYHFLFHRKLTYLIVNLMDNFFN